MNFGISKSTVVLPKIHAGRATTALYINCLLIYFNILYQLSSYFCSCDSSLKNKKIRSTNFEHLKMSVQIPNTVRSNEKIALTMDRVEKSS